MEIPLPPGYRSAVPFDKTKHQRLGIRSSADFARSLNAVYLTTAEFPRACHDYPIAFTRDAAGSIVPVILTGLENGTNLFVDEQGLWKKDVYCPAYVRRFPFFTVTVSDSAHGSALICVDEHGLEMGRPSLITASGKPTDRWREIELLITEMDRAQRSTAMLCQRLERHGLFEAFDADFHPRGRSDIRVGGLLRVNEQRLLQLDEFEQAKLLREGDLGRIYAHLLSLENVQRLLDRYVGSG